MDSDAHHSGVAIKSQPGVLVRKKERHVWIPEKQGFDKSKRPEGRWLFSNYRQWLI
jgi:hypothetical protein